MNVEDSSQMSRNTESKLGALDAENLSVKAGSKGAIPY